MEAVEEFVEAWSGAFVAADAEGREVELFASLIGAEVPVRPEDACRSCWGFIRDDPGYERGTARYVPKWRAHVTLCGACAERVGTR